MNRNFLSNHRVSSAALLSFVVYLMPVFVGYFGVFPLGLVLYRALPIDWSGEAVAFAGVVVLEQLFTGFLAYWLLGGPLNKQRVFVAVITYYFAGWVILISPILFSLVYNRL